MSVGYQGRREKFAVANNCHDCLTVSGRVTPGYRTTPLDAAVALQPHPGKAFYFKFDHHLEMNLFSIIARHPIVTKTSMAFIFGYAGDACAQRIEHYGEMAASESFQYDQNRGPILTLSYTRKYR